MSGKYGLKINEDVLAKMASMAATEVDGVSALKTKVSDIKGIVDRGFGKGVKATVAADGEITLDIYVSVEQSANVKDVAACVQANVKEKVQNMTGSAVNRVNVHVADIELAEEEATEEE